MSVRSARGVLALAVVLCGLPFVNQAFHIDDRIYLEVARHAIENPLFPYDYPPVFEGLVSPDAASHSHLPLTSYYLAIVELSTGSHSEWVLHLAFLVFPLIAVWSFYDLVTRWLKAPMVAALLLLVSPTFLVLSHTLMTEVPLLAFWLLATSRFLRLVDGRGGGADLVLCGLGLVGAAMISLLSLGLVLLLAVHLVVLGRCGHAAGRRSSLWLPLALPLAIWGLWFGIGYLHYGRFLLVRTALHMEKREALSAGLMVAKGFSFLLDIGGAVLLPVAVLYGFASRRAALLFGAVFAICVAILTVVVPGWTLHQALLCGFFAAAGAVALSCFPVQCGKLAPVGPGDSEVSRTGAWWFPLLWFVGIFASCVILYPSGSARYVLLAVPPFLLVWQSSLENLYSSNPYLLRNLGWLTVLLTALWSLPVGWADHQFAELYREEARRLTVEYGAPGRTIWFTAEWGFRHYLEENGARLLARTEVGPKPGDILIKPYVASPWVTLYDGNEYLRLLKQIDGHIPTPVRILDYSSHAGFYSTAWGILPFSVTGGEHFEWFNVFQVKKEYDGPIPEPERHW